MNKWGGQGTDFRDNSFKVEQCNSKAIQQLTDATPEFHNAASRFLPPSPGHFIH